MPIKESLHLKVEANDGLTDKLGRAHFLAETDIFPKILNHKVLTLGSENLISNDGLTDKLGRAHFLAVADVFPKILNHKVLTLSSENLISDI